MSATSSAEISRVARAMLLEYDELHAAIAAQLVESVDSYALVDAGELGTRIGESVTVVLSCLVESRVPSADELARSARTGERRALQGISIAAMIQSFRIAERTLGGELQGWCVRMQLRPASTRSARTALLAHLDTLERAMFEAYADIQRQIEARGQLSEPLFLRKIVSGAPIEPREVEQLSASIGIRDPDATAFIAIAMAPATRLDHTDAEHLRHGIVAALERALERHLVSGTIDAEHGSSVLGVLAWDSTAEALEADLRDVITGFRAMPLHTAISSPVAGLSSVGLAGRDALDALAASLAFGRSNGTVLSTDVLLQVMLHRERGIAKRLAEHDLGPLRATDLLETLRVYLEHDCSLAGTAAALRVHKNTVVYRMHRVTELTGLDLRHPRDLARVVVALEAAVLHDTA